MPRQLITKALCAEAVSTDGSALWWVPVEHMDEQLVSLAVSQDASALRFVPACHQSRALCHAALASDGMALKWVPPDLLMRGMQVDAVSNNGSALHFVPLEDRDGLYAIAFRNGLSLDDLSAAEKGDPAVQAAYSATPRRFRQRSDSTCSPSSSSSAALSRDDNRPSQEMMKGLYRKVPKQLLSKIAGTAEREPARVLESLATLREMQGRGNGRLDATREIHNLVRDGRGDLLLSESLQHLPPELLTLDMCRRAVSSDAWELRFVPPQFLARLVVDDLPAGPMIDDFIPREPGVETIWPQALDQDGTLLEFTPQGERTAYLCRIAVESDGRALQWVPAQVATNELFDMAVRRHAPALLFVPLEQRGDHYATAFRRGLGLEDLPDHERTPEARESYARIPDRFKRGSPAYDPHPDPTRVEPAPPWAAAAASTSLESKHSRI